MHESALVIGKAVVSVYGGPGISTVPMPQSHYVKFRYTKGLCNNLFKLFTACRIAEVEGKQLIEPIFKWNRRPAVKFSDIYDLDYFNSRMQINGKPMIVREASVDQQLIDDRSLTYDLWKGDPLLYNHSRQRKENRIPGGCPSVRVLMALRINPCHQPTIDAQPHINAVHVRWEPEWVGHSKKLQPGVPSGETILVAPSRIAAMCSEQLERSVFFTTGVGHDQVVAEFASEGVTARYSFDETLPYEVNAAINFEICTKAPVFVGNSRSTFSNLITLRRHLTDAGPSLIYNYQNRLLQRYDAGLHFVGSEVVSKKVTVEDMPLSRGGHAFPGA